MATTETPSTEPAARAHHGARFPSILTYDEGAAAARHRLEVAIDLARRQDAHLTVLAIGLDPDFPAYVYGDGVGAVMAERTAEAQQAAAAQAAAARSAIEQAGVLGEAVSRVCTATGFASAVARSARFADLVVTGQPYGERAPALAVDMVEAALFEGDAPVLVCPEAVTAVSAPTVLIGWDGSREALRAVRRALPFLLRADRVEISVFDPDPAQQAQEEDLATMLTRWGARVELARHPRSHDTVAEQLSRRAREIGAGLVVMGAYGHSRFREALIGGATREMLEKSEVPTLMAR